MRNYILIAVLIFAGCGIGSTTQNTMYPDWNYIASYSDGYSDRDTDTSGNCVDYVNKVYYDLKAMGLDVELWRCKTPLGYHRAVLLDGHRVYSVGMTWVFEKGRHNWEWICKIK